MNARMTYVLCCRCQPAVVEEVEVEVEAAVKVEHLKDLERVEIKLSWRGNKYPTRLQYYLLLKVIHRTTSNLHQYYQCLIWRPVIRITI